MNPFPVSSTNSSVFGLCLAAPIDYMNRCVESLDFDTVLEHVPYVGSVSGRKQTGIAAVEWPNE
jgi:hypothetical protein